MINQSNKANTTTQKLHKYFTWKAQDWEKANMHYNYKEYEKSQS